MRTSALHTIKSALGHAEYLFQPWRYGKEECLVLCMHSTPEPYLDQLPALVKRLRKHFTIIGPEAFERYTSGDLQQGPYLLFSFDDGIKNNLKAARVLHELDVHAYFFVVPDFITSSDQRAYYLKHIRPIVDSSFERASIDFEAMSIDDLKTLVQMGHAIGSHTMSHDLHADMDDAQQRNEIQNSKAWLQQHLQTPIRAFCSPNNTNYSVSATGCQCIAEQYDFHFTTFPGLQGAKPTPLLIYRRNIELNWSWGRICYALGRWDLKRWTPAITQYLERMANANSQLSRS